jgi:DNA polymerase III epsilon subunit family exonuclease
VKLSEASYTVFDVETTGLFPYSGDRICEIGAVRATPGKRTVKKFHALADPLRPISAGARAVNGITDDMVRGKPAIEDVLPAFLDFVRGSVLVAYNAGFDLGFLESSMGERGRELDGCVVIDALGLSRRLLSGLGRYNLASVAEHLGVESRGPHRALADAVMTWKVFRVLLKELDRRGVYEVEEAQSRVFRSSRMDASVRGPHIAAIQEAMKARRDLVIVYRSRWNDSMTTRRVTPKRIMRGYDRAYLVAHCHAKGAERNFRVDCIISAECAA